jgi:glycosyltransferase involved in cell wall biosynthesis
MYPLVSIALCTYNGEAYLKEQLSSLINQTYPNFEIVIIDDCSTDNTWAILNSYQDQANLKIYQNERNLGYVKNFEKALSFCTGEFIAFCDQDDIWDEQKIAKLAEAIGDNLLVYCDSELIDEKGNSLGQKMSDLRNFINGSKPEAFIFSNCVSGHAMLIKRELLEYIFPFPENFFHDWWITYTASLLGKIDFVPQVLVKYRQHCNTSTDIRSLRRSSSLTKAAERKQHRDTIVRISSNLRKQNIRFGRDTFYLDSLITHYQNKAFNFFSFDLYNFLIQNRFLFFALFTKNDRRIKRLIFRESRGEYWFLLGLIKKKLKVGF